MSNESRRDESVDRLLRTSMKDVLAGPTTACAEAETLAAWADGALAARERERIEAHVSSCANCQALVAAFARSLPEPAGSAAGAAPGFWTPWRLGWVTAVATAAIAVIVWIAVPRVGEQTPAVQTMASSDAVPEPAPLPTVPQTKAEAATPPSSNAAVGPAESRNTAALEKSQSLRREVAPEQPADLAESRTDALRPASPPPPSTTADMRPEPAAIVASLPPAPPPPLVQAASGERSTTVARQQLENLPSPAGANRPFLGYINLQPGVVGNNRIGGGGQANFMLDGLSALDSRATAIVAEVIPRSPGQGQGQGVAGGVAGRAAAGGRGGQAVVAQTPSAPVSVSRWRILANGQVDRLMSDTPAGQSVVFDAPVFIVAGSAPSALVCWLVGHSGAIALTIDAEHFRSVPFPEAADLRAVLATSAVDATVTTAGGAIYTTTNAGVTWRRIGP